MKRHPLFRSLFFLLLATTTSVLATPPAASPPAATRQVEEGPPGTFQPVPRLPAEALEVLLVDVRSKNTTPFALGELREPGGLLLVFLSNTCPYVLDWSDRIANLAVMAQDRGIGVALINSNGHTRKRDDSPEEMRTFADAHLGGQPYLLDEDSRLADLLRAERTPEVFLYDAQLRLVYRGPIDDHAGPLEKVSQHWLKDAIHSFETGRSAPDSQPALGCAIQRARRRPLPPLPENPQPEKSQPENPGPG